MWMPLPSLPNRGSDWLFVIGIHGQALFVEEHGGASRGRNRLERNGGLREIEAVGKVVGVGIGVAKRVQTEGGLDILQYAAEVVCGMGNVLGLGIG